MLPAPRLALRTSPIKPRIFAIAALAPLLGAAALSPSAQATPVSCQAINASSLLPPTSNAPSPACTQAIAPGDTFEIDFSSVFGSNPGDFSVANTYSLQIANLNTVPTNTLNFTDVEFLVATVANPTAGDFSSITIWRTNEGMDMFTPVFPFAQGLSNYSTNPSTNNFGGNPVSNKAGFSLSGPNGDLGLGTAGFINTFPVNLQGAGISSFTGAKIPR